MRIKIFSLAGNAKDEIRNMETRINDWISMNPTCHEKLAGVYATNDKLIIFIEDE